MESLNVQNVLEPVIGIVFDESGVFRHDDIHSSVMYKKLQTLDGSPIPHIAVYTKTTNAPDEEFEFEAIVSGQYEFAGNSDVNQSVRESIQSIGQLVLEENTYMDNKLCRMYNEIVMRNPQNIAAVGDVYPQIVIENSYDGTRAKNITFGIQIRGGRSATDVISFGFRQTLGKFTQIHRTNATTAMSTAIGGYVEVLTGNISNIITANFDTYVTEESILKSLDMIEKSCGTRRRKEVSAYMADLTDNGTKPTSAWEVFLGITRFSSVQKNINAKVLMENIAERVLVLPVQIRDALNQINE